MQLIYYHWNSQKIVYYFEKDAFDMEFAIPDLRAAYFSSTEKFDSDVSTFQFNWAVNQIVKDTTILPNNLIEHLDLCRFQCACVHDIIRICSAAKIRLMHEAIQFYIAEDDFITTNKQNIENQFREYVSPYFQKIISAKSIAEARFVYRDFWVATKYIDDLVDININKFI